MSVGRTELHVQAELRDFVVIDEGHVGGTACQTRDMADSKSPGRQMWKSVGMISRGILPHDVLNPGMWLNSGNSLFSIWYRSRLVGPLAASTN